jgi:ADP-heptose:LPS heptosyltransferase
VPCSEGVRDDGPPVHADQLDRFFEAMRRERFDLAVQLHGGGRYSNPFVRRLGARVAIGLQAADATPLDRVVPYRHRHHEVLRYLEVVALAGAPPLGIEPRVAVTAADRVEAAGVVPHDDRLMVAINPGAIDPRRRWPVDSFAQVARALIDMSACVVVTGGDVDRPLADRLAAATAGVATCVAGRLSLGGTAALFERCRLVLSNDSGPLHLAAAVGAATVGIYWAANLINMGPPTRTRHRPLVSWALACPVCGADCLRDRCGHDASLVADVPVDAVLAEVVDLLARATPDQVVACGSGSSSRQGTPLSAT